MRTNRSKCPLVNILDILGDKWSLIIIRDLFLGKKTFTEFMNSPEKFASNILSNRLELLIHHGLLKAVKLPHDQKTKLYYLTDTGIDIYPIIYEMMNWSSRNLDSEFGPLGIQFIKDSKKVSSKTYIKRTQTKYTETRNELLNV
jgi:DNA-binding HxlR family transcriptional regulator